MDFVLEMPRTRAGNDTLWVIVDRLMKSARFIPMNSKWDMNQLARAYIKFVVHYHGVRHTIVSDRDTRYLSYFCKSLQHALGTEILHSTSFHPMTDGQTERVNQILEDMLKVIFMEWQGSWDEHLDLVEFSYNNSYQATIQMAPFEALYGRECVCRENFTVAATLGQDMLVQMSEKVKLIRKKMKAAQNKQKS